MADLTPDTVASASIPELSLQQKLGKNVNLRAVFTPERIAASEAEIAKAQDSFLHKAGDRLAEMQKHFQSGKWDETIQKAISGHAFAIRGQGEGLGYHLLAFTADSLCRYTETLTNPAAQDRIVIGKHLETLQAILEERITGDGGALGKSLLEHLQLLIKKFRL